MKIIIKNKITLDEFLAKYKLTKKSIYKLKETSSVKVNEVIIKINNNPILLVDDKVEITEEANEIVPIELGKKINILFENEYMVICEKPHNMLVHSDGNTNNTLLNYLTFQLKCNTLKPIHRIDYETRGIVIFSKNILGNSFLNYQIQNNEIEKFYYAIVEGKMPLTKKYTRIENYIGKNRHENNKYMVVKNKEPNAITDYKVLKNYENTSLVEAKIITGKTHQIRVHMNYLTHPIINDKIYGKYEKGNLGLISKKVVFINPENFKKEEISIWIDLSHYVMMK